jgi:hypothetical protein
MNPFRKLIGALVALWLRDNPHSTGEQWIVSENGVAVRVLFERVNPIGLEESLFRKIPEISFN